LDAEHANPTFDGNAAPTEPRVRLWFGKLGSSSNANSDRPRHRVTVNGELAIRPLLAGQRPSSLNATGSRWRSQTDPFRTVGPTRSGHSNDRGHRVAVLGRRGAL